MNKLYNSKIISVKMDFKRFNKTHYKIKMGFGTTMVSKDNEKLSLKVISSLLRYFLKEDMTPINKIIGAFWSVKMVFIDFDYNPSKESLNSNNKEARVGSLLEIKNQITLKEDNEETNNLYIKAQMIL